MVLSSPSPPTSEGQIMRKPTMDDLSTLMAELRVVYAERPLLAAGVVLFALVHALAAGAAKMGNDPHNQEIALCMLEDYRRNSSPRRDRLLLACAQHTAGHMKYGDPMESYNRFAEAFGLGSSDSRPGSAEPAEAVLDQMEPASEPG